MTYLPLFFDVIFTFLLVLEFQFFFSEIQLSIILKAPLLLFRDFLNFVIVFFFFMLSQLSTHPFLLQVGFQFEHQLLFFHLATILLQAMEFSINSQHIQYQLQQDYLLTVQMLIFSFHLLILAVNSYLYFLLYFVRSLKYQHAI
ncbi:unnamed protein product (macronuclear) [Paramecium tetraurelia]|uniref:Transmembrane protein n=1 Tax=Paramecium tetraurelia TaxID=5888 RepID=A0DFB3_PARTE|nr:uncharacterized protein GSPATT00016543001 [Paramecium tetraurelia]CAK81730.1 unnamed protein product [Paramecium tetraurelia]|eukprot:XP_001449127.1 hypothetical protein (macronuclear) [Paramecium tetraurelia strain d4-2]